MKREGGMGSLIGHILCLVLSLVATICTVIVAVSILQAATSDNSLGFAMAAIVLLTVLFIAGAVGGVFGIVSLIFGIRLIRSCDSFYHRAGIVLTVVTAVCILVCIGAVLTVVIVLQG